ncbi:Cyclin-like_superfamily [Hexamita inflata]|uniref:Cyclin-like superfamily n=1 Tax=Hexamita inflata TaxID=28002 RepID=A0AA86QM30_9EUKA|nr:Cyclin-like superfamily [Hexamita inflata]
MVEVVFENFVNYLRSGNTDKLNIISFQQNQQHKINLSTQLIFYRILTKTVVQLSLFKRLQGSKLNLNFALAACLIISCKYCSIDIALSEIQVISKIPTNILVEHEQLVCEQLNWLFNIKNLM